jgi:hypothetical protein
LNILFARTRHKSHSAIIASALALGLLTSGRVNAAETAPAAASTQPAVRVVGIAAPPYDDASWWSADGTKLTHSPLANSPAIQAIQHWQPSAGQIERVVVLDMPAEPGRDTSVVVSGAGSSSSCTSGAEYYFEQFLMPSTTRSCSIRVGVASAPWLDIADSDGKETSSIGCSVPGPGGSKTETVIFSHISVFDNAPGITVSSTISTRDDTRIVFIDQSGQEVVPTDINAASSDDIQQKTVTCSSLTIPAIKSVKFEERPYEWTDLSNIPLSPNTP